MANLPKMSECPLRDEESKICMCQNMKCEDVDLRPCYGIRNAFQYGCALTEEKYLIEFEGMAKEMLRRVETLKNEQ